MTPESHTRVALVIVGGVLSLAIAAFGLMTYAWGFNTNHPTLVGYLFYLTPILWFPVYLAAVFLARCASYALWLMVLIEWISYSSLQFQDPHTNVRTIGEGLIFWALPLFYPTIVPSILAASFVSFGTRHATLYIDRLYKSYRGAANEPRA
jgi:hypothetical protein